MTQETLWASVTIAVIWSATAVICILAPNLVIEGEGSIPVAVIISPVCAAVATKYVVSWARRSPV
jgi:hypothetical protein